MAAVFTNATTTQDGSGSPVTGSSEITINYTCNPTNGGTLLLWVKTTGAATTFTAIKGYSVNTLEMYDATGKDYYFTWTPKVSGAQGTLDVS